MTMDKMIMGAHTIIYSRKPEADRLFLRDVLGFSNVDVGGGWLIFGLPPAELAVHPSSKSERHELYLMCTDVKKFISAMKKMDVSYSPIESMPWGELTRIRLPGGGKLGVYQPRHARPKALRSPRKRIPG